MGLILLVGVWLGVVLGFTVHRTYAQIPSSRCGYFSYRIQNMVEPEQGQGHIHAFSVGGSWDLVIRVYDLTSTGIMYQELSGDYK